MNENRKINNEDAFIICLIFIIIILGLILLFKAMRVDNSHDINTNTTTYSPTPTKQVAPDDNKDIPDEVRQKLANASVQAFNDKFKRYIGTEITSSQIRSLVSIVYGNNNIGVANTTHKVILLDEAGNTFDVKNLKTDETYTVEIAKYDSDGYITEITVK